MKVLAVSAGFLPAESHGGVPYSTFNLCRELSRRPGVEVRVISSDRNGAHRLAVQTDRWSTYEGLPVAYCSTWRGSYVYAPRMAPLMQEAVAWADVVINSSTLWDYSGALSARCCRRTGTPNVVYPRGLLDSWALGNKRLKKQLGLLVQGRRILREAARVVALSQAERASLLDLGVEAGRIAVLPNGAPELPSFQPQNEREANDAQAGLPRSPYVLCLGRISAKKGLDQTLAAYRQARTARPGLRLVIAGPLDPAYAAEFNRMCAGTSDGNDVLVLPPVAGLRKHLLLRGAEVFVLTSASEGVPMAVLEALQYGLPCLLTHECNIPELEAQGAGLLVRHGDVLAAAQALTRLVSDPVLHASCSRAAVQLACDHYAWPAIAGQTLTMLCGIGPGVPA